MPDNSHVEAALKKQFRSLCLEAQACTICPNLVDKTAVLSDLNGTLEPKVLFIGEAPGRVGADRTRRPFFGDKSGNNFQRLLDSIGLKREQIFITSAVMCSPRSATDANRRPTRTEMKNCSAYLRRVLGLIRPRVVATLGGVALDGLSLIAYHELKLRTHAGRVQSWNDLLLLPLYHPSPQVVAAQRGLDLQLEHFQVLRSLIK